MSEPLPLHRLVAFLSNGSVESTPSQLQLHMLRGWRESTLLSYNAAVKKFMKFVKEEKSLPWSLPACPNDIYNFCFWAGRTELGPTANDISSNSVQKYLYGVQAWHTYHDLPYPHIAEHKVKVLLRACGRQDALTPPKPLKSAMKLEHLMLLYHTWINGTEEDLAALDCCIVAFWGMIRLAEVTYAQRAGTPFWLNSVLYQDVVKSSTTSTSVSLHVRGTKTAKAGVAQQVLLNAQPNCLCPVEAVKRRLSRMTNPTEALFSYVDIQRVNLTRSSLVNKCAKVWVTHGHLGLSGHSFRVGGASLRAALGVSHEQIKQLGRWTSDCYKLYLRDYSAEELSQTLKLISYLNQSNQVI